MVTCHIWKTQRSLMNSKVTYFVSLQDFCTKWNTAQVIRAGDMSSVPPSMSNSTKDQIVSYDWQVFYSITNMHYASSVSEEVSNTCLKIEKSSLAWMNQCWQEKKKICCRTWLKLDLFCSLQGVWKAEIIITGHKGQRNKSEKSRRAPSGEQRGGENSPLVCTFAQRGRYTDRTAQKALRYGTSRLNKRRN